jgi:hypothetical protein
MKIALSIIAVVVLSSFTMLKMTSTKYYFCTSRTLNKSSKNFFLLTEVKSTTEGDIFLKEQIKKWNNFVHDKNHEQCTSDINIYNDSTQAINEFNSEIKYYGDSSKYNIQTVKF